MTTNNQQLATDLATHLTTRNLPPTAAWLTAFLSSIRPTTPLPALQRTALFRILASDITGTTTLSSSASSCFPPDIHNAEAIKERKLPGPVTVQVLDVEDIGHSRWSQLEAIEAKERGEGMKGREIIRIVPGEVDANADADSAANSSSGPHKLCLQDGKGARVYGLEVKAIEGVGVGMNIGAKLVLRDVVVARGVLLLEPRCVTVLGGKIEGLHRAWREGRKERLRLAAGMGEDGGNE